MKQKLVNVNLGRFPKLRTGRLDYGRISHFDNEIGFFQEFLTWILFKIWLIWLDSFD